MRAEFSYAPTLMSEFAPSVGPGMLPGISFFSSSNVLGGEMDTNKKEREREREREREIY